MSTPIAAEIAVPSRRCLDYLELAKPRLNLLVVATTAAGFYLGSSVPLDTLRLGLALLGTGLVAAGASALNQWQERDIDARMQRTRTRPLPAGRLEPRQALAFGALAATAGVLLLALTVNGLTAALACVTCVAYLAIYTPLKRVTPLNTLVGAIPGAIPPVMGWTAARGELTVEAAVLFAILFLWQMPHFLAIAWLYRDDYRAAGLQMISGAPGGARRTGRVAVVHAVALLPVVVLPSVFGLAGRVYLAGAILLAIGFLAAAVHLAARCDDTIARRLFRASLVFLPLLFLLMAFDRVTP